MKERGNFERFKNTQRHILKELGDNAYVKRVIDSGDIRECYDKNWNAECYYLLGMIDYLCHGLSRVRVSCFDHHRLMIDNHQVLHDVHKRRFGQPLPYRLRFTRFLICVVPRF